MTLRRVVKDMKRAKIESGRIDEVKSEMNLCEERRAEAITADPRQLLEKELITWREYFILERGL